MTQKKIVTSGTLLSIRRAREGAASVSTGVVMAREGGSAPLNGS
jgi:hypothetical protein